MSARGTRCLVLAAAVAALVWLAPGRATAWHDRGHMTVALIAYRQLSPADQMKVQDVLKKHPHYDEFLANPGLRPADAPADEWVVMQAAVWPDWVRHHHLKDGFNKPFHHYADHPVRRLDGATAAQKKTIEDNIAALPTQEGSGVLLREYPKRLAEARDATAKPADRAVALCWVFHLVGDSHQPLHAASLFSKDSPDGDRGGNSSFVRWRGRAENLHGIWDGVVGWDDFGRGPGPAVTEYGAVDLMTRTFQTAHPVTPAERAVAKAADWVAESRDLAEKEAYSSNGKAVSIVFSFDTHHHLTGANVKALPTGYEKRAQQVAEKRVALAGLRLADQIKTLP